MPIETIKQSAKDLTEVDNLADELQELNVSPNPDSVQVSDADGNDNTDSPKASLANRVANGVVNHALGTACSGAGYIAGTAATAKAARPLSAAAIKALMGAFVPAPVASATASVMSEAVGTKVSSVAGEFCANAAYSSGPQYIRSLIGNAYDAVQSTANRFFGKQEQVDDLKKSANLDESDFEDLLSSVEVVAVPLTPEQMEELGKQGYDLLEYQEPSKVTNAIKSMAANTAKTALQTAGSVTGGAIGVTLGGIGGRAAGGYLFMMVFSPPGGRVASLGYLAAQKVFAENAGFYTASALRYLGANAGYYLAPIAANKFVDGAKYVAQKATGAVKSTYNALANRLVGAPIPALPEAVELTDFAASDEAQSALTPIYVVPEAEMLEGDMLKAKLNPDSEAGLNQRLNALYADDNSVSEEELAARLQALKLPAVPSTKEVPSDRVTATNSPMTQAQLASNFSALTFGSQASNVDTDISRQAVACLSNGQSKII